jgi:cutinase
MTSSSRRLARVLCLVAAAGTVVPLALISAGSAAAAPPTCADYTFIGVAGSGEGHQDGGMGSQVRAAADAFAARGRAAGKTVAVRPIYYPAAPAPTNTAAIGPFLASINIGAADTQGDFDIVTKACPATKVVMVGYSQGASGVHRALQRLGDRPQIVAAGLIGDPDRLPGDTIRNVGTAGPSQGMAQAAALVAGANGASLPAGLGRRVISVCNTGDPICQWTGDLLNINVAAHTGYSGASVGSQVASIAGL